MLAAFLIAVTKQRQPQEAKDCGASQSEDEVPQGRGMVAAGG